ncbi:class II aldolase/adducin family protein, partial [Aphelenchoides avenae]
ANAKESRLRRLWGIRRRRSPPRLPHDHRVRNSDTGSTCGYREPHHSRPGRRRTRLQDGKTRRFGLPPSTPNHIFHASGGGVNKVSEGAGSSWRIGELEWEAWMRVLDSAAYRTGHIYRQPLLRASTSMYASTISQQSDVATPPAASSMGTVDDSHADTLTAHRVAQMRKEQEKVRWLSSNNYQKVKLLETGTDNPKVITKWVQDLERTPNGTPIKISSTSQFKPPGPDPKEFKQRQKELKENRRIGMMSAGPQSQVLDGVTYEDLAYAKQETEAMGFPARDHAVLIGTASKGIIDRQHQHNAQVYRQLYAPNPFSAETDEDIQKYLKEVELKSRSTSALHQTGQTGLPYRIPDSPPLDNHSLMQAARRYSARNSNAKSASMDEGDEVEVTGTASRLTQLGLNGTRSASPRRGRSEEPRKTLRISPDGKYSVVTTTFDEIGNVSTRLKEPAPSLHSSTSSSGRGTFRLDTSIRSDITSDHDDLKEGKKKKKSGGWFSFGRKKQK